MVPVPQIFRRSLKASVRNPRRPSAVYPRYLSRDASSACCPLRRRNLPSRGWGEAFLRLMKEPQFFHIQYCELEAYAQMFSPNCCSLLQIDPRDAVQNRSDRPRAPLTVFISREIPEYSRKTNNLPARQLQSVAHCSTPAIPCKLVFTIIPEACGLPPIGEEGIKSSEELAARLRTAFMKFVWHTPT